MKIFKKLGILVTTISLLVGMSACTQQPNKETTKTEGITIVDQAGRKVTLEKPAEKVKSTIPLKGHKNWIFSIEIQYVPLVSGNGWNILWFPAVGKKLKFQTC